MCVPGNWTQDLGVSNIILYKPSWKMCKMWHLITQVLLKILSVRRDSLTHNLMVKTKQTQQQELPLLCV